MSAEVSDETIQDLKTLCETLKTAESKDEVVSKAIELFGLKKLLLVAAIDKAQSKENNLAYVQSECEKLLAA
jgi:transcriptional accessory protein Tex/SPT6